MNRLSIAGAAGNIEAVVELIEASRSGVVVCHPHPLYGGSMHDAVVDSLCRGFAGAGVSPLRFNFRGVGASDGAHDSGRGEAEDLVAVCNWFRKEQDLQSLCLGGYSFGAGIALRVAPQLDCQAVVVVAPPLQMLDGAQPAVARTLVMLGERDNIVDCDSAQRYFSGHELVSVNVIAGADHFFMGAGDRIAALAGEFASGA